MSLKGIWSSQDDGKTKRVQKNDYGEEIPGEFEVIGWIEEKERKGMLLEESDKLLLRIYRKYGTLL